ncbi:DUF6566 family protein [Caballeronia sp. TF1N1]|uniref:DUF6566 family protein n=1 Tax=Caballeronia sp. TF1N1 TaxID=2878153 RepID=UPI001FD58921|nr:DUF6566 family protein [Caballeronia sp. TF1N1]
MESAVDVYAGFEISVRAKRNEREAWVADIDVRRDGASVIDEWPQTTQPEWRTIDEALRDGIEWARRTIRHRFLNDPSHSDVAERERAQTWFNDELEHRPGAVVVRVG